MLSFNISYPDLIKISSRLQIPLKEGIRGCETEGDFTDNSNNPKNVSQALFMHITTSGKKECSAI
jgi:hypothetical protein